MALVISVAQQKGGAGKTMLTANLAAAWSSVLRVAVLDIDPQGSLTRWHALRTARGGLPEIAFSDASGWRLPRELDRLQTVADIIVIDTPPHVEADASRAIRAANLVVVPVQPSPPDLWAADGTLKLAMAEKRRVVLVLNRAAAKSRLRAAIEAEIAERALALLPAILGNRNTYPQAFAQGMGVIEAAPKSLAAAEFAVLAAAILEITV